MSGKQTLIGAGGAGLLLVNVWTGPRRKVLSDSLLNSSATPAQKAAGHTELVHTAAALAFVAVATVIAGVSDSWASAMVTVLVGLWIVWAVNRYGNQTANHPNTRSTP